MKTYSKTSFDKIGRPHGLKPLKLEKPKKANFTHFINPPLGEKVLKELFWQKCGLFKALKLEKLKKGKLCSFCKRLLGEKVLKDMLLKALKLKNPQKSKLCSFCKPLTWWKEVCRSKKAKFTHFVSRPFDLFWQRRKLLKALKLEKFENANFIHFVSHRCGEKVHRVFF